MTNTEANWIGVLFGLCLAVLAAYHQFKLPPVLPIFLNAYGYSPTIAGAFMSVYAVAGLFLSFAVGAALQGPHLYKFLQGAFALFVVGSLATIVWPENGWTILAARAVEGIGFAVLAVAGPALCTAHAGRTGLPIAAALVATWIPAGALLSGSLATVISSTGNWQLLWWIGILLTLAMSAWTHRLSRHRSVIQTNRQVAANSESDRPPTEEDVSVLRGQRGTQFLSAALFALWSCQLFGFLTWLPQYLVAVHEFALEDAVMGYALPIVTIGIFNLVAAPILRAGVPVALLLAVALLGQAVIWFLVPFAGGISGLAILAVFGVFAGLTPTCLFALPGTILGVEHAGPRAFGILMTGRNLGVLTGPLLLGAALQYANIWTAWNSTAVVFGVLTMGAALGAAMLFWKLSARRAH